MENILNILKFEKYFLKISLWILENYYKFCLEIKLMFYFRVYLLKRDSFKL